MPENQNNSVDTENVQSDVETSETAAPAAGSAPEFTEAPAIVEAPAAVEAPAETAPQADTKTASAPSKDEETEDEGVKFVDLGIDGRVLAALQDVGYEKPSPIQAATIPLLLEGRDVVGLAQTGTGKTAAFAVPALSRLAELHDLNGPSRKTQALVLAPTRELALQVAEAFTSYAKHIDDFTVLPVYGGSAYGPQLAGLRRGAQVVVGTPGRVIDHISKGSLDLSELQYLVLDEADEMLRMGFAEDVEQIFQQTPAGRQVALFSATMPSQIRRHLQAVPEQPGRGAGQVQDHHRRQHPPALPAGHGPAQARRADPHPRGRRVRGRHRLRADQDGHRGPRRQAALPRLPGCRHQRRHPAAAARTHGRGPARRQDRHPCCHRRRRPRPGRRARQPRGQLRHPARHRVLRPPHRPHRPCRPFRRRHPVHDAAGEVPAAFHREGNPPAGGADAPAHRRNRQHMRLGKFADQITETLASQDVTAFRNLISSYEEEHNVPASEIAAALAVMAQGGQPAAGQGTAGSPGSRSASAPRTASAPAARPAP